MNKFSQQPVEPNASRKIVEELVRLTDRAEALAEKAEKKLQPIAFQAPQGEEICKAQKIMPPLFTEMESIIARASKAITRIENIVDASEV